MYIRGFMATHYIDNTGEIIVFTVLFVFLAILSEVFITFLVIKRNEKTPERNYRQTTVRRIILQMRYPTEAVMNTM